MSESKPTEPTASAPPPHQGRLSDKAPPKPRRRGSSIPAALVATKTAPRIAPPPPKPPRRIRPTAEAPSLEGQNLEAPPASGRSKPSQSKGKHEKVDGRSATSSKSERSERASERPVASGVEALGQAGRDSGRRGSALPWLLAAGVVGGLLWYSQKPNAEAERTQEPAIAANLAETQTSLPKADTQKPEPEAMRTIDLDADEAVPGADAPSINPGTPEPQEVGHAHGAVANPIPNAAATTPEGSEASKAPDATQDPGDQVAAEQTAVKDGAQGDAAVAEGAENADAKKVPPDATAQALPAFDTNAAKQALNASALQASSCRKGDDPTGTAEVIVTFAPSGRVTSANVTGSAYGGTPTGGCIASTLRSAQVPPFSGQHVTVRKLVKVR